MAATELFGGLFQFAFMRHALVGGTAVAVLAGVIGYFVVLRGETFAAHTLSQAGFPGAAGAALLSLPRLIGLIVLCVGSALGIVALGPGRFSDRYGESAAIGSIQAFALALGFLFASLYRGLLNGVNALLFGNVVGISEDQVAGLIVLAVLVLIATAAVGRPLLFLTVDPEAAAAAGVPVRALTAAFLVLVALSVAAVTLITGALLVFALLVMPAAAAQQFTANPRAAVILSVVFGLAIVWAAMTVAYFSDYPIGFFVTTFGYGLYLLARAARGLRAGRRAAA
jgi:zinc/manganese transport system permease protein